MTLKKTKKTQFWLHPKVFPAKKNYLHDEMRVLIMKRLKVSLPSSVTSLLEFFFLINKVSSSSVSSALCSTHVKVNALKFLCAAKKKNFVMLMATIRSSRCKNSKSRLALRLTQFKPCMCPEGRWRRRKNKSTSSFNQFEHVEKQKKDRK